jgi:hypothetical protein
MSDARDEVSMMTRSKVSASHGAVHAVGRDRRTAGTGRAEGKGANDAVNV